MPLNQISLNLQQQKNTSISSLQKNVSESRKVVAWAMSMAE